MANSYSVQVGTVRDFEIIWIDRHTQIFRDLNNVTVEFYHYECAKYAEIKTTRHEPYIITEDCNDTINVGVIWASGIADKHFQLQLDIIDTQLESLGCPPNDFTVPGTNTKVAIIYGKKYYALSACELASIINLDAEGYTAYASGGYVVIRSNYIGSTSYIEIGNGTINCVLCVSIGTRAYGSDVAMIYDIPATPMIHYSLGRYVYPCINISYPPFQVGERYYVMFKGLDPLDGSPENSQEDFTVVDYNTNCGLITSFIK